MMMASGGNEMAFDRGKLTPNFGPGIDPVPRVPPWTCMVFSDPHVTSFDSKRAVYYTSGEFWILGVSRSNFRASAPTRMTKDLSVTREIAISGLFIDDGRLIIAWRVSPRAGCCASRFLQILVSTGEANPLATLAELPFARSFRFAERARRPMPCFFNCLLV